jgi:hypothetical protein
MGRAGEGEGGKGLGEEVHRGGQQGGPVPTEEGEEEEVMEERVLFEQVVVPEGERGGHVKASGQEGEDPGRQVEFGGEAAGIKAQGEAGAVVEEEETEEEEEGLQEVEILVRVQVPQQEVEEACEARLVVVGGGGRGRASLPKSVPPVSLPLLL